jgi:hypothetical protein
LRLALLAFGVGALTAGAQNQGGWKMVGQIGGPTQAIAVQGSYAYAGVGMRLVVLDVSNPSDLREVGVTPPFPHFVEDVAISGTLAYVAAGGAGLRVVDVSNPVLPTEIGAWDSRGYAQGVAVAGTITYLADGPYGLRLVDVSKPSQPVEIGSAYSMNYAFDVAVQGPYAYIAAAGAGLLIADVSDPRHPVEVGSLVTAGYAYGVAVAGSTVYVADGWEGVKTVNVADPAHPTLVAAYKTPGWAFGVTVSGTTAYVADAFGGLRVLDVADAAHPVETGSLKVQGGHAASVAVAGNTAYVADRNWGVRAVNLSAGPDLPQVGSFHPMGYADGVAVSGKYAFIAGANFGFSLIDISDPTRPRQVGNLDVDGLSHDVAARGNFAYLATMGPGLSALHVLDVSDPTHPTRVGFLDCSIGQNRGLYVAGEMAYIADESGLDIVNVSDPQHPVRAAFLRTKEQEQQPETAVGVTVAGTLAYVCLAGGGLTIVDVSKPTNPVRRGTFNCASCLILDVAVAGNRAYVADAWFGLRVLDVTDPDRPVAIGSLQTPARDSVALAGNFAYLAAGDNGMVVVDVSDPYHPTLAGSYRTPGSTRKLAVAGARAFLADGTNGLVILEMAAGVSATSAQPRITQSGITHRPPSGDRPAFLRTPPHHPRQVEPRVGSATTTRAPLATSTCVVTSASDSGAGTLRWCIANADSGTTITFDPAVFPPDKPASIRLASGLPGLSGGITIDGSDAGVILDGSGPRGQGIASALSVPSDGNKVMGLQILGFPRSGIDLTGSHNVIGGDRTRGRGPLGQGNVISGNKEAGITIIGEFGTASSNIVVGNFIGIDASGTKAMGNGIYGVFLHRGTANHIGGNDSRDRNVVSANTTYGINVSARATENLIAGNYVGTDVTGTLAMGNGMDGIMIDHGAFDNVVQGNLCSGNVGAGVAISDGGSSYNAIVGNRIGTDASGTRAVPNLSGGVGVGFLNGEFNRIGGTRPEERNLISGNLGGGIIVMSGGNVVRGNFVGTDITGRNPLGNSGGGVGLGGGRNILGGATPEEANVIGASGWFGVSVSSDYNAILGNHIGTDPSGQFALGNLAAGVALTARHSVVQANVIAHTLMTANGGGGNGVSAPRASNSTIRRNAIYDNARRGIGTAGEPAVPIITSVTLTEVTGTACRGCEVEIFSDSEDEGRLFEGSVVADGSGTFAFTKAYSYLTGPNVTVTATDSGGSTSAFSAPTRVPPRPPRRRAVRY